LYNRAGDVAGKILALITLSPIYIAVYYAAVVAVTRDIHTILIVTGQTLCLALNVLLKNFIAQPRPLQVSSASGSGVVEEQDLDVSIDWFG
jgi:ABC-type Na+ efflux pump permease subunit